MTEKTAWSHLPNAANIDRVIASVKAHPDEWGEVRYESWTEAWGLTVLFGLLFKSSKVSLKD